MIYHFGAIKRGVARGEGESFDNIGRSNVNDRRRDLFILRWLLLLHCHHVDSRGIVALRVLDALLDKNTSFKEYIRPKVVT